MSQKINPLSNKLGIVQVWNSNLPIYGKSFKTCTKVLKMYSFVFDYLKRYCIKYNLLIESIFINYTTHQVFIKVCTVCLQSNYSLEYKKKLLFALEKWLCRPVVLLFYKKSKVSDSSFLISNYLSCLFSQRIISSRQILQIVYRTLKEQSLKTKVVYISTGIKKLTLRGFKIELSGCFDSSRNRMAKTIKCNFGCVPLTKLKGSIDYSSNTFFTKFGSCGLKLWLFYEFE